MKTIGKEVELRPIGSKYRAIWCGREVYADAAGYPFVAPIVEGGLAVNQERPDATVKDENGNVMEGLPEGNITNIDLSGMTITLPDGTMNFIDNLYYDESTKTYHIDSHDTYNTTITNYYTWNYYINYTSITYIGQSEEYNKYYEVYYELPDGRDSADLSKEELEQLSVGLDVIPYGRSADDTSLRSLYHFDGDTEDASYWNYGTDFAWNTGASLTYMESGAFDGCLYLDETEHDFTLTLPSNITSGDFTVQFRYYQSYTTAPVMDSYISFGDTYMLWLNGGAMAYGSARDATTVLAVVPVGSWNEIALVRNGGTLYYYLNGVMVGSVMDVEAYLDTITFHFGNEQQTYKQLDELRILNKAITEFGINYTCTSVPFDTNLALVLPGSYVPVADEYWVIESSGTNILNGDFSNGALPDGYYAGTTYSYATNSAVQAPAMAHLSSYTTVQQFDHYARVTQMGGSIYSNNDAYKRWVGGHYSNVGNWNNAFNEVSDREFCMKTGTTYTLSVLLADGNTYSHTFTFEKNLQELSAFDWGSLGIYCSAISSTPAYHAWVYVLPVSTGSYVDVVYVELVEGSSSDLTGEWVTSVTVFEEDQLRTPTLAVRTDLDITSYQIGGVRTSVPDTGMVWTMIENERITSIQIYNGQAWENVDGRIWTGERWIPASSYNIVTLQDMYDIVDATQDYEYIYSEAGFWSWWQKSWNEFTKELFALLANNDEAGGTSGTAVAE